MIDISEMEKAGVLAKLFNASKAQGMGFLQNQAPDMSTEEAAKLLEESPSKCFDYVRGRVMKINLDTNELDPRLYDRDNGEGAAARALGVI